MEDKQNILFKGHRQKLSKEKGQVLLVEAVSLDGWPRKV